MFNFWDKILKQKKMASLTLLFFIVAGIVLPNVALGSSFVVNSASFGCVGEKVKNVEGKDLPEVRVIIPTINNEHAEKQIDRARAAGMFMTEIRADAVVMAFERPTIIGLNEVFTPACISYFFAYGLTWSGNALTTIGQFLSTSAGVLFNSVTGQLIKDPEKIWAITRDTGIAGKVFYGSWQTIKGWANMLIVLGFIGVALAFVLNLEQYKKLLVPLLIVALLVNFSVVFIGLMIDASNIVMNSFMQGGSAKKVTNLTFEMNHAWNETLLNFTINKVEDSGKYFALSVMIAMIYILIAVTLFMLAIIFIERYVILAILFILSPLAFVFYAFPLPKAKELFKKWWENFMKWCFVGLIGAFFLNLSIQVLAVLEKFIKVAGAQNAEVISKQLSISLFYILIVIFFLLAGMWLTFKSSGWMSGMVIAASIATGTAIMSGGAAFGTAVMSGGAALAGKLAVGTGKVAGRGFSALGSKEGWKNIGSGVKSAVSNAPGAIWSGMKATGRGIKAAPGTLRSAPGAALRGIQATGSAIYQTGTAAWNAATTDNFKKGLALAKQGVATAPKAVWEGIKTGAGVGWKGIKTGAGATSDAAFSGTGAALRGAGIALSGRSDIKGTMSDWITKLGEWSGAVDQGTVDRAQLDRNRKKVEEPLKRYEAVQKNRGSEALANMRKSARFPEEQAAIDSVLAQNNALYLVGDTQKQQEAMNNAMKFGLSGSDFTKNNADLIDAKKMREKELRYAEDVKAGRMSLGQARTKSIIDTQSDNFSSMKIDNIENIGDEDVAREAREKTARGAKFLHEANKRDILNVVDKDYKVVGELMQESNEKYHSNTLREAIRKTPFYKRYDRPAVEKRIAEIVAANPARALDTTFNVNRDAEEQLINEGYRGKVLDLSREALGDVSFLRNAKPESLGKQLDKLSAPKINELKKWTTDPLKRDEKVAEFKRLKGLGRIKEAENIRAVMRKIIAYTK